MKMVIASGKGGTGKSMLTSSMSLLFSEERDVVACDCDVDAPNLGLWLGVTEYDSIDQVSTSERASIDPEKCIECGECFEKCQFGAVEKDDGYSINPLLCEGCGVCYLVCPSDAVNLSKVMNGEIRVNKTRHKFPVISGHLYPGETGSGKIVQELRKRADRFKHDMMLIDSSAGIGCPVIASITGCDYALLVTEPTPTGFSDLERVLEIINHFQIPYGIALNKWDINKSFSEKIESWSAENFLGKIRYDKEVVNSIVKLEPVIYSDSDVVDDIRKIYENIKRELKQREIGDI